MALDHRRLIRPGKKSGQIFCVRQVYFAKSCQQIWVRVNQPFIPFVHHIWGETVLWGTVFIIQTSDRKQYFTILQKYKLHLFNIQDDGSTRGLLAKPLGSHFCSASCGECLNEYKTELRSNIIKNLLCLFFIQWFTARPFGYSCKRCSLNDQKQSAQRLKSQERLLTINKRNRIRWNIYKDNNFHSGIQVLKCL